MSNSRFKGGGDELININDDDRTTIGLTLSLMRSRLTWLTSIFQPVEDQRVLSTVPSWQLLGTFTTQLGPHLFETRFFSICILPTLSLETDPKQAQQQGQQGDSGVSKDGGGLFTSSTSQPLSSGKALVEQQARPPLTVGTPAAGGGSAVAMADGESINVDIETISTNSDKNPIPRSSTPPAPATGNNANGNNDFAAAAATNNTSSCHDRDSQLQQQSLETLMPSKIAFEFLDYPDQFYYLPEDCASETVQSSSPGPEMLSSFSIPYKRYQDQDQEIKKQKVRPATTTSRRTKYIPMTMRIQKASDELVRCLNAHSALESTTALRNKRQSRLVTAECSSHLWKGFSQKDDPDGKITNLATQQLLRSMVSEKTNNHRQGGGGGGRSNGRAKSASVGSRVDNGGHHSNSADTNMRYPNGQHDASLSLSSQQQMQGVQQQLSSLSPSIATAAATTTTSRKNRRKRADSSVSNASGTAAFNGSESVHNALSKMGLLH
ncbi:hypothetical protein H4219_005022 [Mycoemilia scoparia]|uniref:Uncharacterized protein n=1 Tax=Mycoemilia scoparia TaxID=417184 RepID=A0A9W7ZPH6_9FUNG|nr:hypothetical protein H4219_005022 [Mycoemilia scoparia]